MKKDEERGMSGRQVTSNSHAAVRDGRPPPIPEEPEVPKEKESGHEKSVLQAKLTKLAIQIGYAGMSHLYFSFCNFVQSKVLLNICLLSGTAIAVLTVVVMFVRFSVETYAIQKKQFHVKHASSFVTFIITGITVLVVAVPEGLPLAVTLSLAYSVKVCV